MTTTADLLEKDIAERKARARAVYSGRGRQRLQQMAEVAASSAPRAIDYLEQAPVLLLLVWASRGRTRGGDPSLDLKTRQRIAWHYADASARRLKLRAFMEQRCWPQLYRIGSLRTITLPQPAPGGLYVLRKIKGAALRPAYVPALLRLACWIEPAVLANLIPRTACRQESWLRQLSSFEGRLARRMTAPQGASEGAVNMLRDAERAAFVNFAQVSASLSRDPPDGSHCADFIIQTGQFDIAFEPQQFLRALEAWQDSFAVERSGASRDIMVSYAPLFDEPAPMAPLEFVPLRSAAQLAEEGRVMRHCVAGYAQEVMQGLSFIYSVRRDGARVATLELRKDFNGHGSSLRAAQLKGPRNSAVEAYVLKVVTQFVMACAARYRNPPVLERALHDQPAT